jgi:hypothetical protein
VTISPLSFFYETKRAAGVLSGGPCFLESTTIRRGRRTKGAELTPNRGTGGADFGGLDFSKLGGMGGMGMPGMPGGEEGDDDDEGDDDMPALEGEDEKDAAKPEAAKTS